MVHRSLLPVIKILLKRLVGTLVTLLIIVILTMLGLVMSQRGREKLPLEPVPILTGTVQAVADYFFNHPETYTYRKAEIPAIAYIADVFVKSAGLLGVSLAIAVLVGIPLGLFIALDRRGRRGPLGVTLSVLGISVPSFMLAMLFHILNIQLHNSLQIKALPPTGFGWDTHLVMPALVLAARPLTQIAQVTYITLAEVLKQDYIRLAQAKGLPWRLINWRHAFRNALLPILTTIGASLRYSLASLPVVEFFYLWPGIGLTLLTAINTGLDSQVADLTVSLGLLFLLVNLLLESLYPLLDPRVGRQEVNLEGEDGQGPGELFHDSMTAVRDVLRRLRGLLRRRVKPALTPLPAGPVEISNGELEQPTHGSWHKLAMHWLGNPAMIAGTVLAVGLLALVLFGRQLSPASPYESNGVMIIDGVIGSPPYKPSSVFPWGTDHIGRDVQSMVLSGARQTLSLAFFGTLLRILIGAILGVLAGWRRDGWLDRLVMGTVGVWAAFPATIFAMILILGLGIQKGMWVFVAAIGIVGWGEVAQIMRSKVMELKPKSFVESARAIGLRPLQILANHILPNLFSSIILLGVLEMGGVLMLLAELGILNIFLGGGYRVEWSIGKFVAFSDVPEWGAMLANVREWWRSYPWMAFYPGAAFFLSILTFNLWGEGLRRFLDESRVNIRRFNRVIFSFVGISALGLGLVLRSNAPMGVYQAEAKSFNPEYALSAIEYLSRPEFQGRAAGTAGARMAAEWIARYMDAIGLQRAGENNTFLQTTTCEFTWLQGVPAITMLDGSGAPVYEAKYRQDFAETESTYSTQPDTAGVITGLAMGETKPDNPAYLHYIDADLASRILVVSLEDGVRLDLNQDLAGILMYTHDTQEVERKYLTLNTGPAQLARYLRYPVMLVSAELADRLLATAGTSTTGLENQAAGLVEQEYALTPDGTTVQLHYPLGGAAQDAQPCYNVIGFIPGQGALIGSEFGRGGGQDSQVIMVTASYDGLGMDQDGTIYPGANDNLSGVAAVLELARAIQESPSKPDKTVVFVLWSGAERGLSLTSKEVMNSLPGFNELTIEAIVELSSLGYGDGDKLVIGEDSSYRLYKLFNKAARRVGLDTLVVDQSVRYHTKPVRGDLMGRQAMTLYAHWENPDRYAHTTQDTWETIDLEKLQQSGRAILLSLQVMIHEEAY